MTLTPKRLGWLPMAGAALVLISILAFFFVRTQSYNPAAYTDKITIVRQFKQQDSRWEVDVMKARMGISPNYDALSAHLAEFKGLMVRMRTLVLNDHPKTAPLTLVDQALNSAIWKKADLIERFKTHNSALRDALLSLPIAADNVQVALRSAHEIRPDTARAISSDVATSLLNTMVYNQTPSDKAAAAIRAEQPQLAPGQEIPSYLRDKIDVFNAKVDTVLSELPLVNGLLHDISAVPTIARMDDFYITMSGEERQLEGEAQQNRQYLLIFSAALVALFLYAAARLIRSNAVINRINKELHEANEGLERRVEERTRELSATNAALTDTQGAIRNLLDNADQGFLTIAGDLLVEAQSSAACAAILGEAPAGKPIVDLLCRTAPAQTRSALRATLQSVLGESRDYIRDLKLGLLPTLFDLDGKFIKTGYKFLAESGRLMLILTDVTETVQLTETVERERQRVEMIVLAFTEGEALAALVDDYRKFLSEELPPLLARIATPAAAAELYRHIHTYKGLLAQFSFHFSPPLLHAFETRLAAEKNWTEKAARAALGPNALLAGLERDLQSVGDVLGPDFLTSGRRTVLSQQQLQAIEQTAKDLLAGNEGQAASQSLRQLLQTLAGLSRLDVKAALALHSRGANALATRLQKELVPIHVGGDVASLDPECGAEFLRSLVHVFRNAVDHGIETPEDRALAGKPAEGTIACHVRNREGWIEILIADDGHGVDRAALEARLIAAGTTASQVKSLSLEDLMFREGLSSRDSASEVSGRGIGLAAVRNELERLGGTVTVESERGVGTRLRFRLPTAPDAAANNVQIPALERVRA